MQIAIIMNITTVTAVMITAVNNTARTQISEICEGRLWYFPDLVLTFARIGFSPSEAVMPWSP
jgi:hypothetical protein